MTVPDPTPVFRLIHIDNLSICLQRGGLYAPNHEPNDGLVYRTIHNVDIQRDRHVTHIPCGPGGVAHDYVPFYLGYLSPMLLQLKTGRVDGYVEGQEPLIYLVASAQKISRSGAGFVFSDGHGIAAFTDWYDDLCHLGKIDWDMVYKRYWKDEPDGDNDRKRRKQAEFLVHRCCDWSLIDEIAVSTESTKEEVERILNRSRSGHLPLVSVRPDWYYY